MKTETETLLNAAQDMARRAFDDPTEACVMELFRRLCMEHDERVYAERGQATGGETIH